MKTFLMTIVFLLSVSGSSFGSCCDHTCRRDLSLYNHPGRYLDPPRDAPSGWCARPELFIYESHIAANIPPFFKGNLDTLLSQVYIQGPIDKTVYQAGVKWDLVHLGFLGLDGFEYYSEATDKVEMIVKRTAFPDEIYAIFNLGIIENIVFPLPEGIKSWGYPKVSDDGQTVLMFDLSSFPAGTYIFKARWHGTPWWGKWSDPIEISKPAKSSGVKIVKQ